jgi:hypothetical protein
MPTYDEPVYVLNEAGKPVVSLVGKSQPAISLTDVQGNSRIVLNGLGGALFMRAKMQPGQILGDIVVSLDCDTGNLFLGGSGAHGDLILFPATVITGQNPLAKTGEATIHLSTANKYLLMRGENGEQSIRIDGGGANCYIGGNGMDGDVVIYPSTVSNDAPPGMSSIHLSGDGSLITVRSEGQETIRIDGKKGDIILANADGAEEFEVEDDRAEPGSVLIIADESRLRLADRPYDRRVAGIISGAAGIRPGIVLGRGREGSRVPVALFGRVNCLVDAS